MIEVKDLMGILNDILTDEQMSTLADRLQKIKPTKENAVVKDDFTVERKAQKGRGPVTAGDNKWEDNGEEKDNIDFLLGNSIDSENKRSKIAHKPRDTGKIDKVCSVCHRTVKAPRVFSGTNYYRCESCIGK